MICLVSHDVGGAELLSRWSRNNKKKFLYCIKGPAIKIFKRNIKNFKNTSIQNIKRKTTKIITSTSKESDHEIKYLKYGIEKKIKTISLLDHWVNYKSRFIRDKKMILPNELWVTDEFAYNIAKKNFDLKISKKKNYYLEDFFKNYKKEQADYENKFALYVSSTTKNLNHDKKRLLYFLKFKDFFKKKNLKILIKLHPAESKKKYYWLKKNFSKDVLLDNKSDLKDLLLKSKYVIGCNSMAMVVALHLNKKVFNGFPPGEDKNQLPFKNIKKLKFIK